MSTVIQALEERGLIEAMTTPELEEITKPPLKVYCGFDPTSDSLHLGNMIAIMGLAWFQRYGHTPVVILGGATGMIGDPSGKSNERSLLDEATLKSNVTSIEQNFKSILLRDSKLSAPLFLNNLDWFQNFSFIDFLREVGKHFRVGAMLGKESVRARLQSEEGMSYTEFSYQLLQGYDFLHLFQKHGVTLQLGGSDQWGNITAGCELVRKLTGGSVHGITIPLLVKSDGQKFGKSEKGAIWLSPEKLSPYEFYQYLYRTEDRDVIKLLKMLTFVDMNTIVALEQDMKKPEYIANTAQKLLAAQVTDLVHGEDGLVKALKATEAVMPGKVATVSAVELRQLMKEVPSKKMNKDAVDGKKVVDIIALAGFLPSKGEVRRLIKNGGLYLNNFKVADEEKVVTAQDYVEGQFLLFALGKKNKAIIELD
ncbi:MAG: tyrS [Chlamydiia bacterium]|nr:tyrS [Chlamydiia bacterium]